jgi:hypothetical protein
MSTIVPNAHCYRFVIVSAGLRRISGNSVIEVGFYAPAAAFDNRWRDSIGASSMAGVRDRLREWA